MYVRVNNYEAEYLESTYVESVSQDIDRQMADVTYSSTIKFIRSSILKIVSTDTVKVISAVL
jgi:hypothetical protein